MRRISEARGEDLPATAPVFVTDSGEEAFRFGVSWVGSPRLMSAAGKLLQEDAREGIDSSDSASFQTVQLPPIFVPEDQLAYFPRQAEP